MNDPSPTPTSPAARDRAWLSEALAVGLGLWVAYLLLRTTDLLALGAFNDDGVYTAIGAAIARGHGYRLLHLVGEPVAVKYPPGLPTLLAIPWTIGGSLSAIRTTVGILHPLLCGVAAAQLWWLGRRRLGLSRAVLAMLVIGPFLLAPAIEYYNLALSEPYFVAGWATALVLAARLLEVTPGPPRPGTAVALGLTLSLTTLFRSAALVIIPAVVLALVIRGCRRREVILCTVAALLPLGAWSLFHAHLMAQGPLPQIPDETSYWRWLPVRDPVHMVPYFIHVVVNNSIAYASDLGRQLSDRPLLGGLGVVIGGAAIVFGAVRQLLWRPDLVLSVIASLAAILLWPFSQDRLLLPWLPFAGLLAAAGLDEAPRRIRHAVWIVLGLAAVAVAVRQQRMRQAAELAALTNAPLPPVNMSPRFVLLRNSRYILSLAGWVRTHTTSRDRLVVPFPGAIFLYTGRQTIPGAPADPAFGPSAFALPGRYLARRILLDSATVIAVPSAALLLATDIATIQAHCPDLLQWVGDGSPGSYPAIYRVAPDRTCLRLRMGEDASPLDG
ncbi:MAG: hypothetical protein ACREMF_06405 [Gemmatimonadales bacterium]